ncbi:vWA domain-containing protein [Actibacterium sp. MT2.3-13A]|uniref:vWA domain-containing protein n=1 Tax=Actibacterium sp. MT2.3-13A TaxID=2828332 RepID=UPI001BA92FEF|nr:vWA domain-containing protein [Actibacterium sp. MT2.3-13A]
MWTNLIIGLIFTAISYLLTPKPKGPKPGTLDDFGIPRAAEGDEIGKIYGTVWIKSPQVAWYGDLRTEKIRKGGGLFSSGQVVGHKYYLGLHLVTCQAPIDHIRAIMFQDKVAWEGVANARQININKRELFGKAKREGGVSGYIDVESGAATQAANDYLQGVHGATIPAFRGVQGLVFRQFYVGNSANLRPISVKESNVYSTYGSWYPEKAAVNTAADVDGSYIYIALDNSSLITAAEATAQADGVKAFLEGLKGQTVSIRIVAYNGVGSSATEILNCTDADYDTLQAWIDALPAGTSWIDYEEAVTSAPVFFGQYDTAQVTDYLRDDNDYIETNRMLALANPTSREATEDAPDTRKIILFFASGGPLYTWSFNNAKAVIDALTNVDVYCFGINYASTTYTGPLDNTPADAVPNLADDAGITAAINSALATWQDINPAHILRDIVVSPTSGGAGDGSVIGDSFEAVADTLYDENFGLSFHHATPSAKGEFKQLIEQHIDGHMYFDRVSGKWEVKLIRDDHGLQQANAIYIALDFSGSMTAPYSDHITTAKTALQTFLEGLKGTAHSVKILAFNSAVVASTQILNCTDADYDTLKAWVAALGTPSGGTDYGAAVSEAAAFFTAAGDLHKRILFITDGYPDPTSTAATAVATIAGIPAVKVSAYNISTTDTTYTLMLDNTPCDSVPVVSGTDASELAAAMARTIAGEVFDASNIVEWVENARPLQEDLPNQLTVVYTKRSDGSTASLTATNVAAVQMLGRVIPDKREYLGISDDDLAARVALRDLSALTVPLQSGAIRVTHACPSLNVGSAIVINEPNVGITNMICRVTEIEEGDGRDNTVLIRFVEDKFSTESSGIISVPQIDEVSGDALPPTAPWVEEMPYWLAVQQFGETTINAQLGQDAGLGMIAATCDRPSGLHAEAVIAEYDGSYWYRKDETGFAPLAEVKTAVSAAADATTITVIYDASMADVTAGDLCSIGDEIIRIDNAVLAGSDVTLTVGRGCLDTVPAAHAAGSNLIVWARAYGVSPTEYTAGDVAQVKVLPATGTDVLAPSRAVTHTITMASRMSRPYPAGQFKIAAAYTSTGIVTGTLAGTWVHRDRTQQTDATVEDHTDASVGPETGSTYLPLRVPVLADGSFGTEQSYTEQAGTVTSWTYNADPVDLFDYADLFDAADLFDYVWPDQTRTLRLAVRTKRDGYNSWQDAFVDVAPLLEPVDLAVTAEAAPVVNALTWTPRCACDSLKVYRSEAPFDIQSLPTALDTLASTATGYDDTTATPETVYYYRVGAVEGAVERLSSTVVVTTAAGVWLLTGGTWSDVGSWDDASSWID